MSICHHCHEHPVNRPRGLCWGCYYRPGVREKYPSTSKFAYRGVGNFSGNAPLPVAPTSARPGSREKLEILAERARMRQSLWHPMDASDAPVPAVAAEAVPELAELMAG